MAEIEAPFPARRRQSEGGLVSPLHWRPRHLLDTSLDLALLVGSMALAPLLPTPTMVSFSLAFTLLIPTQHSHSVSTVPVSSQPRSRCQGPSAPAALRPLHFLLHIKLKWYMVFPNGERERVVGREGGRERTLSLQGWCLDLGWGIHNHVQHLVTSGRECSLLRSTREKPGLGEARDDRRDGGQER